MDSFMAYLLYGLGWLSFGLVHSLLATETGGNFLKNITGYYWRLVYNLIAVLHIGAILWLGGFLFTNPHFIDFTGQQVRGLFVLKIIGWSIFVVALWPYDLKRLVGITYIKEKSCNLPAEDLRTSGFNRYTRHPAYSAGLVIIWSRVATNLDVATAIFATIYIVIGLYFEERKLTRLYGQEYKTYKARVPALIPWRGKAI